MYSEDNNDSSKDLSENSELSSNSNAPQKNLGLSLPITNECQSSKNPFYKRLNGHTKFCNGSFSFHNRKRFLIDLKKTRISFNKVQKPNEVSQELIDGELILSDGNTQKKEYLYKAKLNYEVIANFLEMTKMERSTNEEIQARIAMLPDLKTKKLSNKVLFLDMDDTLIHSIKPGEKLANIDEKLIHTIQYFEPSNPNMVNMKVIIRPFAIKFIEEMSTIYEIVV